MTRRASWLAILDDNRGGRFKIAPRDGTVATKQFYWPKTNVLVTRFLSSEGIDQITDFMSVGLPEGGPARHWLIRQVHVVSRTMAFRLKCQPAFDYARQRHETRLSDFGAYFHARTAQVCRAPRPA